MLTNKEIFILSCVVAVNMVTISYLLEVIGNLRYANGMLDLIDETMTALEKKENEHHGA